MIKLKGYSKKPLTNGIMFLDPYKNKFQIFNKDYIKKRILNNVGIMNGYYKMLQKYVMNNIDIQQLKTKLINIIDKVNIYFCDVPKKILGLTICNSDIFISGKYLQEAMHKTDKNRFYNFVAISKIFLTLAHEYSHQLQYTLRTTNNNYFIKTFYFKKENDVNFLIINEMDVENSEINAEFKNIPMLSDEVINYKMSYCKLHNIPTERESGQFFDNELFLGQTIDDISKNMSKFFLLCTCGNYKQYISIIDKLLEKNSEDRTTNSSFKSVEGEKAECYYSFIRKINN